MTSKKINTLAWLLTNSLTFSSSNNGKDKKDDKKKTTGKQEEKQEQKPKDEKDVIIKNINDELIKIDNVFSDKNHEKKIKNFLDNLFKSVYVKDTAKKYILNKQLTKDVLEKNLKNCFFAYNDTLDKTLFIFNEDLTQEIKKYKSNGNELKTKLKELLSKEGNSNFIVIDIIAKNDNIIDKIDLFRCTSPEDKSVLKLKLEDEEKDLLLEECNLFYTNLERTEYAVSSLGVNKENSLEDIKKRRSELKERLGKLTLLPQYIYLKEKTDEGFDVKRQYTYTYKLFNAFKKKSLDEMTKEINELEKKLEEKRKNDADYRRKCEEQDKCGKEYADELNKNADNVNKVKDFIINFSQKCVDICSGTDFTKKIDIKSLFKNIFKDVNKAEYKTSDETDLKEYFEDNRNFIYSFFEKININFFSLKTTFKKMQDMLSYLEYYLKDEVNSIRSGLLLERSASID